MFSLAGIFWVVAGPKISLSKADASRAMVNYHFAQTNVIGAFEKLRSIQFDPLKPVGCNHDLVLQSRVKGYKIGDWHTWAYERRHIYDGWDKQASLVPFSGYSLRRIYHHWQKNWLDQINAEYPKVVVAVLKELEEKGHLSPRELEIQVRNESWAGSWYGPSVTKQCLRALWHAGKIMTSTRKSGQHVYDLTERIVPPGLLSAPPMSEYDSIIELTLERHLALGIMRPQAPAEIWSMRIPSTTKKSSIHFLTDSGRISHAEIEGKTVFVSQELVNTLDSAPPPKVVKFIAPLDQFMWDRKLISHLFGFDYIWEVYVPESKRKYGYYVLPVLFGTELVARVEFFARDGNLQVRRWIWEPGGNSKGFWKAFSPALYQFMSYCGAVEITIDQCVDIKDCEAILGCFRDQK